MNKLPFLSSTGKEIQVTAQTDFFNLSDLGSIRPGQKDLMVRSQ